MGSVHDAKIRKTVAASVNAAINAAVKGDAKETELTALAATVKTHDTAIAALNTEVANIGKATGGAH